MASSASALGQEASGQAGRAGQSRQHDGRLLGDRCLLILIGSVTRGVVFTGNEGRD